MTGKQLRELREARSKTREELAEWLGDCSASTVNKWERDMHTIPQWVEEKMLSSVQIALPLDDLKTLIDYAQMRNLPFESILAEAVKSYIRKPAAAIIEFPAQTMKVAEEALADPLPPKKKP